MNGGGVELTDRRRLRTKAQTGLRLAVLAAAASTALPANAVLTYFTAGGGARRITLQVGSDNAAINFVTFNVANANIAPTPTPVTGAAGGGAPPTAVAGGILVVLTTNRRGNFPDVVRLVANSSTPLTCQSGTCLGSGVTIPFTTISWTSYEAGGGAFAGGIASGAFTGAANQSLFAQTVPVFAGDSLLASNVLVFSYDNATLYPSGLYSGRVTFTATVP